MPRGVYDRSKTKEQRVSEKQHIGAAKKTGRKPGRKAQKTRVLYAGPEREASVSTGSPAEKLASIQGYFTTLVQANATPNFSFLIGDQISNALRRMESLAEQIAPLPAQTIQARDEDAGEETEEGEESDAQAPVAFNPPQPVAHS